MNRHSSDVVSLVAGLIFIGIAALWAMARADLLPGSRGWLLPVVLVAAGAAGLYTAVRRGRDAEGAGQEPLGGQEGGPA
ncbi:MAG: hypothetical protein ABJA34_00265 [Pseudonocardiales bacterium]